MAEKAYGVKLVRGPVVDVSRHPDAPADKAELEQSPRPNGLVAADLFCGCGGISLGLEALGVSALVGVDHDQHALQTWGNLFPGLPLHADLHDPDTIDDLVETLSGLEIDILTGGPPCQPFSRAGRSGMRDLVRRGLRDAHDRRRDLWQSFVEVAVRVRPRAVIMENVPELALADDMLLLRTIVDELEDADYQVHTKIVSAQDHGVPQHRQRLFLVALRERRHFSWPEAAKDVITLADAIEDMPPVEGGWRPEGGAAGWVEYEPADTDFVEIIRSGVPSQSANRLYDHITRPVRDDDRRIFEQMDSSTKYTDIDPDLQRYRDDIFTDKYKRLDFDQPSRSITAHIAKDGYWYIHPSQHRTITIREAARIQTFPDRVRFAGPPSSAFRQIGNAVPPRLAERVGRSVIDAIGGPEGEAVPTRRIAAVLAAWQRSNADSETVGWPWLSGKEATPWQVVAAEIFLGRDERATASLGWNALLRLMHDPETTIRNAERVRSLASLRGKPERGASVLEAAEFLTRLPHSRLDAWEELAEAPGVSATIAKLAETAAANDSPGHILPLQGSLRVAARFTGTPVDRINSSSDGRLALARMVGGSVYGDCEEARAAILGLIELASTLCSIKKPACDRCPLADLGCEGAVALEGLGGKA
jgi:DNA (cytosine-5)-methyltransferase 1